MNWWNRLPTWAQFAIGIPGIIILLTIMFSGGDDAEDSSDDPPAAQEEPDVDTGRMTSDEFALANGAINDFRAEITEYGGQLGGKCAVLASAGDLAAFSDCVGAGYEGVDDQAGLSYGTLDDLKGDTAKGCRKAVLGARKALDRAYRSVKVANGLAENLQLTADVSGAVSADLRGASRRYNKAAGMLRRECRP